MIKEIIKPTKTYIKVSIPKEYLNQEILITIDRINKNTDKSKKNSFFDRHIKNPLHIAPNVEFLSREEANER